MCRPHARRNQLDLLNELNATHLRRHAGQRRTRSPPGALRTGRADADRRARRARSLEGDRGDAKLYGIDNPKSAEYGKRCLLARRLVERGVRFVQIFLSGQPWDTHSKNAASLKNLCAMTDQPSAGLVLDLKRRGLLDSTIVMWTGEFGRLPISQGADGRDHNRHAFSLWLAGGGFKKGYVHGATDDFGYKSVEKVVRVSDLHATLLHALGPGSHEADLPARGPRRHPDGCRRDAREGRPRLNCLIGRQIKGCP